MKKLTTLFLTVILSFCLFSFNLFEKETLDYSTVEKLANVTIQNSPSATTTEITSGSIIIDMGVVSQTIENGLKPYGLIYKLIKENSIPILWSINPNKNKDGIDFTVDGRDFKGGAFIIRPEYISSDVLTTINEWNRNGVVTYTTTSTVSVPVYKELTYFPTWVLDEDNGKIAEKYLKNAGIPEDAYVTALPSELDECHDLFVLPHAKPSWEDHGNLLQWNSPLAEGGNQGYIWSGCTAVSNMENLYNPNNPSEQLNFLALKNRDAVNNGDTYFENALVLADNHEDASNTTHNIDFATDPFMQFIGQTDDVHKGGKEEIYLPVNGGGWRPTTKVSIWDTNQEDLGFLSPGKAALMVYGPAFGDDNRGMVMYQAGHDLNKDGSEAEIVAAQRGFLNFSFDAASAKVPEIIINTPGTTEITLTNGESFNFDITGIAISGGNVTYEWSSSCSIGSFDNPSSPNPTFTIPNSPVIQSPQSCIITAKVIDECGRVSFINYIVTLDDQPTGSCSINDITASNPSACNDNNSSNPGDDFFTADITVTFINPPAQGFLQLDGDVITGISIPVSQMDSNTSHTFTNVQLPANGNDLELNVFFLNGEEIECSFTKPAVITAPESCSTSTPVPCSINAIAASNPTQCNDNGTDDANDDFFTADITVSFANPPLEGFLQLSGEVNLEVNAGELDTTTSHTFTNVQLPANGNTLEFSAVFVNGIGEEPCKFDAIAVINAPESCSVGVPGFCSLNSISASNLSTCNDNGTSNGSDDFFTADITVFFTTPPSSGFLQLSGESLVSGTGITVNQLDSDTSHTFVGVSIFTTGRNVILNAFFLNGEEEEECSITNQFVLTAPDNCSTTSCSIISIAAANTSDCNDAGTDVTSDDFFTTDFVISFASLPLEGFLQIEGDYNTIVELNELDSNTSHTLRDIQLPADGSTISLSASFINAEGTTACELTNTTVLTAPESCFIICNITAIDATNSSSCIEGATADDNFFTSDITVYFDTAPRSGRLIVAGDGNASVDVSNLDNATSHTFTSLELPADGRFIRLTATFENGSSIEECTFEDTDVATAPLCCDTTGGDTSCSITAITSSNIICNVDPVRAANTNVEVDITITYSSVPDTGVLKLTGDTTIFIPVSRLDSSVSHTFKSLSFPIDQSPYDLIAFFMDEDNIIECGFNQQLEINCENGTGSIFKNVSVHPNPSNGSVTIETPQVSENILVYVTDMLGRKIITKYVDPKRKNIELHNLPKGVLLINLTSKENNITKKIIVE